MSTAQIEPSTTYRAVLGQILARHRAAQGLDQGAFATKLGLSQSAWSRVETGGSNLSVEQLKLAADALQTTPGTILGETEKALAYLQRRGVNVFTSPGDVNGAAMALLGGAALGLLIAALFKK
jgi:transcriptional regulator with XRE-family HTH domain